MQEELIKSKKDSPIRLVSSRFGELTVPSQYIWSFPEGLIGFKAYTQWALINTSSNSESMFMWLHSIERSDLALPVMNPLAVFQDYQVRQDEPEIMRLKLDQAGDVQILVIVTVPHGDPSGITANMAAPIILQNRSHNGWQVILERGNYKVAEPLFKSRTKADNDTEKLVSVGTSCPPISVLKDRKNGFSEDYDNDHIVNTKIRLEEVVSPPETQS